MIRLSAKSRFTAIMVLTASVAMLLVGALAWSEGEESLKEAEFTHLESVRVAKARLIEDYFDTVQKQIITMAEDETTIAAMKAFDDSFFELQNGSTFERYDSALEQFYTANFLPKLAENSISGTPDYDSFAPRNPAAGYLQYYYTANKPLSADKDGIYTYAKAPDGSAYSDVHSKYHMGFRDFLVRFGYYDVFLVTPDSGDIIYSVAKEVDYATSLMEGPYRNTGISEAVQAVMKDPIKQKTHLIDFQTYAPSYNAPASFMATPIYEGRDLIGVLVFQMPIDKIQNIMTSDRQWRKEGMGESGETYIIGPDNLMRSDSRFLLEEPERYFDMIRNMGVQDDTIELIEKLGTTILLQPVRTEGANASLRGQEGHFVADDYRGVRVLSAYQKLDIEGLDWGIVSEIDEDESFSPVRRLLQRILISTAIFIPIVAYLSFWLSQSFMSPVRNLIDIARNMRKNYEAENHDAGDKIRFETKGASEYQELSTEMNGIIDKVREDMIDTRQQKKEYTDLITSALPAAVAEQFRHGEREIYHSANQATSICIYLDNFQISTSGDNFRRALELQEIMDSKIHELALLYGIDLFNQIGMEYVGVCGLTTPYLNHLQRTLNYSTELSRAVREFNMRYSMKVEAHIGLDVGPLFGGLQVDTVLDYDVHGDAIVNAQRLAHIYELGELQLTQGALDFAKSLDIALDTKKCSEKLDIDGKSSVIWSLDLSELGEIA